MGMRIHIDEYSAGGKPRLGRISKRGDAYLRTLLVYGARSELTHTARRNDHKSRWAEHPQSRQVGFLLRAVIEISPTTCLRIPPTLAENRNYGFFFGK
jgi:transposase